MKNGYVYIVSNKTRSTLYIGVTSDLINRIYLHKQGLASNFSSRYKTRYLMYYEEHGSMYQTITREKQLKKWKRSWKLRLIKSINPEMKDLWSEILPH